MFEKKFLTGRKERMIKSTACRLLFILTLFPMVSVAHPGIGIVKDSKGNIYYTDLMKIWKITKGSKQVIIPEAHSHELYIDSADNLYGENGYYDPATEKFFHYLWVYRPNGKIDTVIGMKEQFLFQNFSLAKDKNGNEYYTKRFLIAHKDTTHIYRKSPEGQESIFATGDFKDVNWLHPQDDGSLLYVARNAVYRVEPSGSVKLVKENIGNAKPSFKFSGNSITILGVWQDLSNTIYAAVFSDQAVKRINSDGTLTTIYTSQSNWSPIHGVFDNENNLWVLESSDKNEVRATFVQLNSTPVQKSGNDWVYYLLGGGLLLVIFFLFRRHHRSSPLNTINKSA